MERAAAKEKKEDEEAANQVLNLEGNASGDAKMDGNE